MEEIVIVSASRTPIGKFLGSLSTLSAPLLCSYAIKDALKKAHLKPSDVDEVVMGNVLQAGIGQNPARQAAICAGISDVVGATTINKVCGSGMKAVIIAVERVQTGNAEVVVAGGMESMSHTPHILKGSREIKKYGDIQKKELAEWKRDFVLIDSMIHDGLQCAFNSCHMGTLAEAVAKKYSISRKEQDGFSLESHRKAVEATEKAKFKKEIVPVKSGVIIRNDEGPRKDTSAEKMSSLKTVFDKKGTITAGNASQLSDGASALVITSAKKARKMGLKPLARIENYAESAVDPAWYTIAPVHSVKKLLKKTKHSLDDFDLIELNEAYAVQALAVIKELNINKEKLNINGGAVALGHPIGCSGARILTTLIHALHDRKKKLGLATLCIGGGEAIAMSVERI